jgi:hypothetical protein
MSSAQFDLSQLQELESIELPCYVSGNAPAEKAFEMLGGKEVTMNNVRHSMKSIKFSFLDEGSAKKGFEGTRCDTLGIVMRVSKPAARSSSSSGGGGRKRDSSIGANATTMEPVGKLLHAYKFEDPADFQFLPTSTYTVDSSSSSSSSSRNSSSSDSGFELYKKLCPPYVKDITKPGVVRVSESGDKKDDNHYHHQHQHQHQPQQGNSIVLECRPSDLMQRDKSMTSAHTEGLFSSEEARADVAAITASGGAQTAVRKKVISVAYVRILF